MGSMARLLQGASKEAHKYGYFTRGGPIDWDGSRGIARLRRRCIELIETASNPSVDRSNQRSVYRMH